jgi:hypothetical protein
MCVVGGARPRLQPSTVSTSTDANAAVIYQYEEIDGDRVSCLTCGSTLPRDDDSLVLHVSARHYTGDIGGFSPAMVQRVA